MATERLAPDAIAASANLSGAVTAIQDDPDSPDGSWLTATADGASDLRVSFASPSGNPTTGAGAQNFRAQVRKNSSGGNSVDWSLELWEAGVSVAVLATGATSSTTGEVVVGSWDAASLGTADGSSVQCRVVQTGGDSGNPNNRRYLEIGAVEWNVDYQVAAKVLSAETGSFVVTGQSATLKADRTLAAAAGSFALTGQDAGLAYGRVVAAEAGSYTLTGQAAGLKADRSLAAEVGSFTLTGNAATLTAGGADPVLTAEAGSFSLTGQAAGLKADRRLSAEAGPFGVTGQAAALRKASVLFASTDSYALSGAAAGLRRGFTLTGGAGGAFTLSGSSVGLRRAAKLAASTGVFAFTGQAVTLSYSGGLPPPAIANRPDDALPVMRVFFG